MLIKKFRALLILSIIILSTACTSVSEELIASTTVTGTANKNPTQIATSTAVQSTIIFPDPAAAQLLPDFGPDNFPVNINPLTGLEVADIALLERRPVAVKVNNYPRSNRPQWGLSLADIVFEYYHNNDLPRFHAIFYGHEAEMVGPIRSARLFDNYLIELYKTNFTFASADSRILEQLLSHGYADRLVFTLTGNCPPEPVCRYQPENQNYLVADTTQLGNYLSNQGVDNSRQDLDGMMFSYSIPSGGENLERVYIRYSLSAYLYWEFDAVTGTYLRFQDTQEDISGSGEAYELLTDRLTGETIRAENVVVLVIPHYFWYYQPSTGSTPAVEIVDMEFEGSGQAFALRDGQVFEVSWVRPTDSDVLFLENSDGSRYEFKPGATWFQVISDISALERSKNAWRFQFLIQQ
ncbi:MAG: DUF3048 domain-containing protein [Chloroflexi bacterium]|nr:DUF3048 domain-containing protein [Chloroflexota bacterium]